MALGRGDGTFDSVWTVALGTNRTGLVPLSLAVGDLNGDGRPDLIAANSCPNDVTGLLTRP